MTIKKKLYVSFGIILVTVMVLLAINLIAVQREHEAKAAAQQSIDMTEVITARMIIPVAIPTIFLLIDGLSIRWAPG